MRCSAGGCSGRRRDSGRHRGRGRRRRRDRQRPPRSASRDRRRARPSAVDVLEATVAPVAIKRIRSPAGDEQVGPAVVVVVADGDAVAVTAAGMTAMPGASVTSSNVPSRGSGTDDRLHGRRIRPEGTARPGRRRRRASRRRRSRASRRRRTWLRVGAGFGACDRCREENGAPPIRRRPRTAASLAWWPPAGRARMNVKTRHQIGNRRVESLASGHGVER